MREIKFRAWEKEEGTMIYDANVMGANDPEIQEMWEFMQYTGLKDKNGVEIYEGDIVKVEDREPFVVSWGDNASWGELCSLQCEINIIEGLNERRGNRPPHHIHYCEVIGNVWENKELLK